MRRVDKLRLTDEANRRASLPGAKESRSLFDTVRDASPDGSDRLRGIPDIPAHFRLQTNPGINPIFLRLQTSAYRKVAGFEISSGRDRLTVFEAFRMLFFRGPNKREKGLNFLSDAENAARKGLPSEDHAKLRNIVLDVCRLELFGDKKNSIPRESDEGVRIMAGIILEGLKDERARPLFISLLKSNDAKLYRSCLDGIAKLGTDADLKFLVDLAAGGRSKKLKESALDALEHHPSPDKIPFMFRKLFVRKGEVTSGAFTLFVRSLNEVMKGRVLSTKTDRAAKIRGNHRVIADFMDRFSYAEIFRERYYGHEEQLPDDKIAVLMAANALGRIPLLQNLFEFMKNANKKTSTELAQEYKLI